MPQLDGLRALAVFVVFACHWLGCKPVNWGSVGVILFFVLSGFLITGILLRSRGRVESGESSPGAAVRQFYVRRALRIFPLYYLTLLVAALLFKAIRDVFPWHLTYSTNFYVWVHDRWPGIGSHFWSLAVEEQFYLVWPWLIIFLPARLLLPLLACCIIGAPAFRLWASAIGHSTGSADTLTPACLDALGLGALLALSTNSPVVGVGFRARFVRTAILLGLPSALVLGGLQQAGLVGWWDRLFPTALALAFVGLIDAGARQSGSLWGRFLQSPPLAYLGKISYGLYLLHPFAAGVLERASRHLTWIVVPQQPLPRFLSFALATIALASLSWYCFEAPINRLKDRWAPTRT